MIATPMPPLRAVWLLTRLRLRRQLNLIGSMFNRKGSDAQGRRVGTAPKAGAGWLIGLGLTVLIMFMAFAGARQAVYNLACLATQGCQAANINGATEAMLAKVLHAAPGPVDQVLMGFAWILCLLVLMSVLVPLSSTELSQDSDLEWLSTLPLKRRLLLVARVVERSVVNSVAIWSIWPVLTVLAWYGKWGWLSPLVSLPPTVLMLLLAGVGRTLGDTGLRRLLPPSGLRNMQAVLSLAGMPCMLMAMAYGMSNTGSAATNQVLGLIAHLPRWLLDTPPGLAVQALYLRDGDAALAAFGLALLSIVTLVVAAVLLMEAQLRGGITNSGRREAGRARRPAQPRWQLGNAVHGRELRLLGRDRNFLVQTLVLPVAMVAMQFMMNARSDGLPALVQNAGVVGAIAFGLAAYVLMQSAFQTLNTEGAALWLLYTVPRPLERILRDKAVLWSVLGLAYPLIMLAGAAWLGGGLSQELAAVAVLVLLGVPIYGTIAVAMGVFGCNPLAEEKTKRINPAYSNLYLLLVAFYSYVMFARDWYQKLVILVLSAALAAAMWQKARDRLPYLLDPAASPPSRVSLADGLIGLMMFNVLQGLILLIAYRGSAAPGLPALTISFGVAGALTFASLRLVYWRAGTQGVPRLMPERLVRALGWGVVAGLLPAVGAWLYLRHLTALGQAFTPLTDTARLALPVLSVLMAPLAEEFICRGLVYGGLRRSVPDWVAIVLSSALFAAVHPSLSVVPVFFAGACFALAYRATGTLLAPILAHAIYNVVVLAMQW
jgi:hypothetical protein